MTRRDAWKARPAVLRYMAFKDEVRIHRLELPDAGAHVVFFVPMPKSWSAKKRRAMEGQPHQQRPDVDNYTKALMDAARGEDSGIWDIRATKIWAPVGMIEIRALEPPEMKSPPPGNGNKPGAG